jgi:hypothetical protein
MSCERCGAPIAVNYLEVYNPDTKAHKTVILCNSCMVWAFELTDQFRGGQRCRPEYAPDAGSIPRSIFYGRLGRANGSARIASGSFMGGPKSR